MEGGEGQGESEPSGVASEVRRAPAEVAAQSEKKVSAACDHPPGLRDEFAVHIEASGMAMMQDKSP